jgi:uncharacterized protein involved in outer membrane biogenesis
MRWKKIVIPAASVLVVLILALYTFVEFYDFNKFKPLIAKAVQEATGRELNIKGDIDIDIGIRPTIVVEDVSFQNAAWSARPDLGRVKRLEVQMAVWPLIIGKFDFAHLVLVEPDVIVEFESSGTSNFSFDTAGEEKDESEIHPPPLIFSDIRIEKGLFTYTDAQSNFKFSVGIDHLAAKIPGFDEPLQLDFKGTFDDIPLTLNGTVGPIWAWVAPGYSLPANITATSGGSTATIIGELRDPINFKDLEFDITARGSSVADIAKLAGRSGVPELGAFKLTAKVNDPAGHLAIEKLGIQIGSRELVAISLTGDVKNVLALQGVNLNFTAQSQDTTRLTQLGLPALPERGAFRIDAQLTDPENKVYAVNDLSVVLGENEINGQVNLNLAQEVPFLTAGLTSQKFRFGQFNLDLEMTGPFGKPAIKKIDLKLGTPDLAEIRLNGVVEDLRELQGVDIDFQAGGIDLANLKQVTGQPLPVRGAFSAAGKVLIPVRKNLQVPDLKITAGKNNITGSLHLDLSGDQPQLETKLSLPKLDLPSVLLPELAKQKWARGSGLIGPVKLDATLYGFSKEMALKRVDLRAGTLKSAKLRLTGSIPNMVNLGGIDLHLSLQGNEIAKLKDITGQTYFFAPVPGQGKYTISGKISDKTAMNIEVNDFKFALADTELTGRLDLNLAAQPPQYVVDVSTPKFNMKPFPIPKEAAYANLNKIDDLGPLKIHSKVIVEDDILSLSQLEIQAGKEQLAAVQVKGSIKNLTSQSGINLNVSIKGNEIANLAKITGQSIPLKGAYAISGRLADAAPKNYKIGNLKFRLGANNITGGLDLNLSGKQLQFSTELASPKLTLQPVTLPALETLSRIKDLGPLKLAVKIGGAGKKLALQNLYLNLGREDLIAVLVKGTIKDLAVPQGMKLDFTVRGKNLTNIQKLGGPAVPFQGAFNVSGQASDPAPKIYKISSLEAVWGENDRSGWVELNLTKKRPQLRAYLSAQKLDLRTLIPRAETEHAAKAAPSASVKNKDKLFPAEPLPLKGLKAIDADLKFRDKQVLLPTMALDDVIVDALLKNGNLEIKPFKFSIGGGKADVQFALRSQKTPATLAATLNVDQLEIGPMLDQLGYQRSVEGNLDAAFNLDGSGDSVAALMAGLNGNIRIAMSNGRTASAYLDLLEKYLGSGILRMLNPFEEKREYTPINCFVNKIGIKDGMADIKILLDTDRTSIFSAGNVNLKTESLDLGIKPTPKKGAMPANISFSFKELSQPFRLGGTLANPHLAIDAGRTAFVIGKMAGALALGPIGWAAFFADVSVGKKDACAVALGKADIKDQPSDSKKPDEKKKEKKSGGFFKRLFGK